MVILVVASRILVVTNVFSGERGLHSLDQKSHEAMLILYVLELQSTWGYRGATPTKERPCKGFLVVHAITVLESTQVGV